MAVKITVYGQANMKQIQAAKEDLKRLETQTRTSATGFSGSMARFSSSAQNAGKKISGAGDTMTKNLTVPLAAIGAGLALATDAAAKDAQAQVVLANNLKNAAGASADQVKATEDWITQQGIAKGVADDELRPALSNLAMATHDVNKAQDLAGMAMDIAAAKGVSVETASKAIAKAYGGQTGALAKLVPGIDAATLKSKDFGAVSDQVNQIVGGAAAAAADTQAGALQKSKVAMGEATENLGTAFLPMMQTGADLLNNTVIPAISSVTSWFSGLPDGTKQAAVGAGIFVAAIGPIASIGGRVVSGIGSMAKGISSMASTASSAVSGVKNLATGLSQAGAASAEGAGKMVKLGGAIRSGVSSLGSMTAALAKSAAAWAVQAAKIALSTAASMASKVAQMAQAVATGVATAAQWLLNVAMTANPIGLIIAGIVALIAVIVLIATHFDTFKNVVSAVWDGIKTAIMTVVNWIKTAVVAYITAYINVLKAVFNGLKAGVAAVWNGIKTAIETVVNWIKTAVVTYITTYVNTVKTVISGLRTAFTNVFEAIKSVVQTAVQTVKNVLGGIGDIVSKVIGFFGKIRDGIKDKIGAVLDIIKGLPGRILTNLGNIASTLLNVGKDLISGLINGIKDKAADVINTIKSFITDKIPDFVKNALGIQSPSRVMMAVGKWIPAGLAQGIKDNAEAVAKATADMAKATTTAAKETARTALQEAIQGSKDLQAQFTQTLSESADTGLQTVKDRAQQALDFIKSVKDSIISYGSITTFKADDKHTTTGSSVLANMKARVAQAQAFGKDVEALRALGLNNTTLQEIISAGPEAGDQIAKALLMRGKANVAQANTLQNQLGKAGAVVGDTASLSQYGTTKAQAQSVVNTTVTVKEGAIVLNIGAGTSAADQAEIKATVAHAVQVGLRNLTRELNSR